MPFEKICVLGLGYIGLPTACTFATTGIRVVGVDTNPHVVETLNGGGLHLHEPGLRALVADALASGNLTVVAEPQPADAFIIAVPTPFRENQTGIHDGREYKLADLGAVRSAAQSIAPVLRAGNLVVLESTSPVGTTRDLLTPILEGSGLKAGKDFNLCYSPERVLPGQILRELVENARIIGGLTPECARRGHGLYSLFVRGEIVETDATTAEMVKLMENTFRDVNIAVANEFARVANESGVDVWEAISLANRHPRVNILSPGPGVGGHCISVDPWFLVESAPELTPLISSARRVNDDQPEFVVSLIAQSFGSLRDRRIAALGLAYKPDVDDLRESPALEVVRRLARRGARVTSWEPFAAGRTLAGVESAAGLPEALAGADLIVLLVPHKQFVALTPAEISGLTPARLVFDAVNAWSSEEWSAAGFTVRRLGDGRAARTS